jgi:hypothetical protein
VNWPKRILVYGCECCGGVGTNPTLLHNDCQALRDWHQWFERFGSPRPPAEENPHVVPLKMLAYVPGDEEEVDVNRA